MTRAKEVTKKTATKAAVKATKKTPKAKKSETSVTKAKSQKTKKTTVKKATKGKKTPKTSKKSASEIKLEAKLSNVEKLHVQNKVSSKTKKSSSLMVISPFRLPVDIDTWVANSARYGGLSFIFFGAILAASFSQIISQESNASMLASTPCASTDLACLMNAQQDQLSNDASTQFNNLNDAVDQQSDDLKTTTEQQSAQLSNEVEDQSEQLSSQVDAQSQSLADAVDSQSQALADTADEQSDSLANEADQQSAELEQTSQAQKLALQDDVTNTSASLTEKPVTFSLSQTGDLTGSTELSIGVEGATGVTVYVFSKNWNKNIDLGQAVRKNNNNWTFIWNTKNYENGEYIIKALIRTENGSYEKVYDKIVKINNPQLKTAGPVSLPMDVTFSDDRNTITVIQNFGPMETGDEIKVYLKNIQTNKITSIASVFTDGSYRASDFIFKRSFSVKNFDAGRYLLVVRRFSEGLLINESVETVILDGSSQAQNTATPGIKEQFARVIVPENGILFGFVELAIESSSATAVELYAVNTASVNELYIGRARKIDDNYWVMNWDTRDLPNSSYNLYAKVKTFTGTFDSERTLVKVANEVRSNPTEKQLEDLAKRAQELEALLKDNVIFEDDDSAINKDLKLESENSEGLIPADDGVVSTSSTIQSDPVTDFLLQNSDYVKEEFRQYTAAIRSGNQSSIKAAEVRLFNLENEFGDFVLDRSDSERQMERFVQYVANRKERIVNDIRIVDEIVKQRQGDGLFVDTDKDGISDFDEIYFYKTDPFSADTSGNGVPDGVAILSGLDPLSSDTSQSIVFESPKETSLIRDDILSVQSITPVTNDSQYQDDSGAKFEITPFVISGKALPNSFVTVYVFSLPTIITVRTESDGSWTYRFEKELEDGEHTIYVAMTDNSGRILARSNPLTFVKEAQAFSVLNEPFEDGAGNPQSFASPYTFLSSSLIYLTLSFGVVAIGLILLMLGMYLDYRKKKGYEVEMQPSAT